MAKVYGAFYRDPEDTTGRPYHWANGKSKWEALKLLAENAPLPESWDIRPVVDGMPESYLWEVVASDPPPPTS